MGEMNSSVGNITAIDNAAADTLRAAIRQGEGSQPAVSILKLQWPLSGPGRGPWGIPVLEDACD